MHIEHLAEIIMAHLHKSLVAQDTGVVDEDVDPAPALLDDGDHLVDRSGIGDAGAIGHGFATQGGDFIDHELCRRQRTARTVARAAEVINHDFGTAPGQIKRISAAKATTGPGNDGDTIIKTQSHCKQSHWLSASLYPVSAASQRVRIGGRVRLAAANWQRQAGSGAASSA